jgi:hypothetical protein
MKKMKITIMKMMSTMMTGKMTMAEMKMMMMRSKTKKKGKEKTKNLMNSTLKRSSKT